MIKTYRVFWQEYQHHVMRKRFLLMMFSIPVLLMVVLGIAILGVFLTQDKRPVGVIDHGKAMLYGTLAEVRQKYATQDIILNTTTTLPEKITGVEKIVDMNSHKKLILQPGYSAQAVLYELVKKDVFIDHFEIAVPSLDEIFIRVVTEGAPKT